MDFTEFLLEAKFAKIMNALRGDVPHVNQMGIMTAQNPLGVEAPAQQNNAANRELLKELRRANFRGYPVNPRWIMGKFGNIEDSYFIPHIDRNTLITLGARFGQRSVIWGQKMQDEDGTYIRFEYIDTPAETLPLDPSTYQTSQTRDVVLAGKEAAERSDLFSAKPFPRSGIDKRTGRPATVRKFVIPFFDPTYEKAKFAPDKASVMKPVEDSVSAEPSFLSSELPDTPEVRRLVEEIRNREGSLYAQGKVQRWYWESRGLLEVSLQKLREVLKG
jgi:hypothetical protein